jgi:hypothetical protein
MLCINNNILLSVDAIAAIAAAIAAASAAASAAAFACSALSVGDAGIANCKVIADGTNLS